MDLIRWWMRPETQNFVCFCKLVKGKMYHGITCAALESDRNVALLSQVRMTSDLVCMIVGILRSTMHKTVMPIQSHT